MKKSKRDCKVIDFLEAKNAIHVGRVLSYFARFEKEYILTRLRELQDKLYKRGSKYGPK